MTNSYVLVTNDGYSLSGTRIDALEIAKHRLRKSIWPIYHKTAHRDSITAGDNVLIYVGGAGRARQCFIALAKVSSVAKPNGEQHEMPDLVPDAAYKLLHLREIRFLSNHVPIRPLLGKLTFVPKVQTKWGTYLIGGCKRATKRDVEKIETLASHPKRSS